MTKKHACGACVLPDSRSSPTATATAWAADLSRHPGGRRSGAPRLRASDACQNMTGNHWARSRYPGGLRGRTRPAYRTR